MAGPIASSFKATDSWSQALAESIRDPDLLIDLLGLPDDLRSAARQAAGLFPLMVPRSYLARMRRGDVHDPLLRQVLPLGLEAVETPGFVRDAVGDHAARRAPGLLQKYAGRALLVATGVCAVNCRFCFRRHYPYETEPRRLDDWEPAFALIEQDQSLHEVILSGGDPLMLTDVRLQQIFARLATIPHVRRVRVHTRLPIVLPERMTPSLLDIFLAGPATTIVVVHANHPAELADTCGETLQRLVRAGLTVLNQAVLLRGVNDDVNVLAELCEELVNLGVLPYYLHQLDRVAGTAHFEVPEEEGRALITELRRRLPGYAVPRYVREIEGAESKTGI